MRGKNKREISGKLFSTSVFETMLGHGASFQEAHFLQLSPPSLGALMVGFLL